MKVAIRIFIRITKKAFRTLHVMVLASLNENTYSSFRDWSKKSYASPAPHFVKQSCILRNRIPESIFVETGTFMGDTTALLGKVSKRVISIEPEISLFEKAVVRFKKNKHIEILNGTSEEIFPILIPTLIGNVSFWLDGHYSSGNTFKGEQETPIVDELKEIAKSLKNFKQVVVMVDDVRCFDPSIEQFKTYPTRSYLVNWADSNGFEWTIEHDIFVAKAAIPFESISSQSVQH